jgi:PAS domain S-box-containing protein
MDRGVALRHIITGVTSEVSDAVIVTDDDFRIRSWNTAAERLYGWAEHEVLDRRIEDILRFVASDTTLAAVRQTLGDKGRWFGELSLIARDGSPVNVWTSSATIRDASGQPALVAGVHRPVITHSTVPPASERVALDERVIRNALECGEFVSHYERIVALEPRRVVALAACPRWNHPELGPLAPADLIDSKEHVGAFVDVERMAFARACEQMSTWRQSGLELDLTLHLSNPQLADASLFEDIAATLASSGLDPRALWLEVTETALVEDIDLAADLLHRFEVLGVRVAVDNFGIGWASLTYLKQLPVHALKIDKHFVAGVLNDHRDAAISRSIVALGQDLGLAVVAVGVETDAQDAALRALSCGFGQGPLYGSPTPAAGLDLEGARRR